MCIIIFGQINNIVIVIVIVIRMLHRPKNILKYKGKVARNIIYI